MKTIMKKCITVTFIFAMLLTSVASVEAKTAPRYNDYVNHLYATILNREADFNGAVYWVSELKTGTSPQYVAAALFNSKEFKNRDLTNSAFVDVLYKALVGRKADTQGKKFWVNKLNWSTSRQQVITEFMNTQECINYISSYGF